MFVIRKEHLPPDPVFPADLKQLGYFVNDKDQIKQIADPEKDFLFKINVNERYNEMQKEALNACIRRIVLGRLYDLGLETLRLPLDASPKTQHAPILASTDIGKKSRIIVVFGESSQDLGVWAYRSIGTAGINKGSAVDFTAAVLDKAKAKDGKDGESVGLIIANPGQLIWHCGGERAVTLPTWQAIPKKSALHPQLRMSYRNKIPGNHTYNDHVVNVFEEVLGKVVSKDARIDIIGLAECGCTIIEYLSENWAMWNKRISAMCLSSPLHTKNGLDPAFSDFVSSRCRAYEVSDLPIDQAVEGRQDYGCNCYSSGESLNQECIMPSAWKSMLGWLDRMHANRNHEEVEILIGNDAADIASAWEGYNDGAEVHEVEVGKEVVVEKPKE